MLEANQVSMWKFNNDLFLIEVCSPTIAARITKWNFAKLGPSRGINHYRRQFLIPKAKKQLAMKLLGIPHQKNLNRIKAGKQAAKNHPVTRGQR